MVLNHDSNNPSSLDEGPRLREVGAATKQKKIFTKNKRVVPLREQPGESKQESLRSFRELL